MAERLVLIRHQEYHIENLVRVDKKRTANSNFDKENQDTANKLFSEIEKIVQTR